MDPNQDYAQVLAEYQGGAEQVFYTYGDDLLSQTRAGAPSYYHYDALGSTRALTDAAGSLTDAYAYKAFGEIAAQRGATPNAYLFAGEQFDPSLRQYYLRARYMEPRVGRFTRMDSFEGGATLPPSLHKYMYSSNTPLNATDPHGLFSLSEMSAAESIRSALLGLQSETGLFVMDGLLDPDNVAQNAAVSIGVVALGAGGFKLVRMLSRKGRAFSKAHGLASCSSMCVQQLRGKEYEQYLHDVLGLGSNFKAGGREFDAFAGGKTHQDAWLWIEAKAASYWEPMMKNKVELEKFWSSIPQKKKIAERAGKKFMLYSGGPIPSWFKVWMENKGIDYLETID